MNIMFCRLDYSGSEPFIYYTPHMEPSICPLTIIAHYNFTHSTTEITFEWLVQV